MLQEPTEITAGDKLSWSVHDPDYLPADGWTLKYALRGPIAIDITTTADNDSHLVDVASSVTTAYPAGVYSLARYVEKAGNRVTRFTGRFTIKPDLISQGAGYDGRSHAEKVLAAIERVIEGRATRGDQELQFDGKKIIKMTVNELITLRQKYRAELQSEKKAAKIAAGLNSGNKILVRFR